MARSATANPGTAVATVATAPLVLVWDDDFSVKQRARQIYEGWCAEAGGFDHEIIDAAVQNGGEALTAIGRLREALNTLPFFGGSKVVWFQNCSFLGEDRTAASSVVTTALTELAEELKGFKWHGVRLLVSAGKPDKRRVFYKTLEKLGVSEAFTALSAEDKDWAATAETHVVKLLRAVGKEIGDDGLAELVTRVGPNLRALASEVEKLGLYVGARPGITLADVQAIVTRQKHARAFALAEALPALRLLDTCGLLHALLPEVTGQDPVSARVTTLQEEKQINTFLRLSSPSVIAALREAFPDLPDKPNAKTVFVKLRELRNQW